MGCTIMEERSISVRLNVHSASTTVISLWVRSSYIDQSMNPETFQGHPQEDHETSHGSMKTTRWFVEENGVKVVAGRKYTSGDSGATMLCSMICRQLERHVHLATCTCTGGVIQANREVRHNNATVTGNPPGGERDWISHRLFWAQSG
ncbi:hypothetical protein FRC14_002940 [Serendipita sp. 396]|nr:hypothetical protein FRC14_002940 [Serendipita sp. 396]